MIERHWDGIAAHCHPENKVALGFVEGLNNKIRMLRLRAYGLRDEECLRLKLLTCMLPELQKRQLLSTRSGEEPYKITYIQTPDLYSKDQPF
jgi:Transposase